MSGVMPVEDLVALVRAYNPRSDASMIRRAYAYARRMHEGQTRHSGEPYFSHPVEVASLLTEQRLDDATIACALLHDTVEDTRSTREEVAARFGEEIARLVDGVTKLTNLGLTSRETRQAENFRKLFMAMSHDMRVILVKLTDRLHNMRTIEHMKPHKQRIKAEETMDLYAPLAGRMGMQWMRDELEDLSFAVLNPEGRMSIMHRFEQLRGEAGDLIPRIRHDIEEALEREGLRAEVIGRAKRPFSIWRKMQSSDHAFFRLSDVWGFRILTEDVADCYRALGAIHGRWRAVPGRFKDYVSQPKANGYRSIHTTVSGRDGKRVEVQIRTHAMHEVAERGVAAHWAYRDGVPSENPFAVDPAEWLRDVTERFEAADDHGEFMEVVKLEMQSDQVFCFTPKGKVIALPKGATPIDFAYAIHTRIGHRCVGAKVDGLRAPLFERLETGQSVEIITAEGQSPQASWMEMVVTGRARSAIRRALRAERRAGMIRLGRELARAAFSHAGKRATDKALETAARAMGHAGVDDLLEAVGAAEVTASAAVAALFPELAQERPEPDVDPARAIVSELDDRTQYTRADCCRPLPGERIVGLKRRGHGVIVHSIACRALADVDGDDWVDLRWHPGQHPPRSPVWLAVTIANDAGVLGRVCTLIGEQRANISDLLFVTRNPDFFVLRIEVEVRDVDHLRAVLMAVEADGDVARVERHAGEIGAEIAGGPRPPARGASGGRRMGDMVPA
jgi:RelA/SpoT family (p)ppGpp synthetase